MLLDISSSFSLGVEMSNIPDNADVLSGKNMSELTDNDDELFKGDMSDITDQLEVLFSSTTSSLFCLARGVIIFDTAVDVER